MVQDTRKDPRAKVLTMTVRYKSATIDEFIEHHSHDVSRGGIYIKTPSPFPPGTLLKFEIRIAEDKSIIGGVGRVVWKRDAAQSNNDRPAGMGVKFLKIDENSRQVIDRIILNKGDEPSAYDDADKIDDEPAQPEAATAVESTPVPAPTPARPVKSNKATMLGLGAVSLPTDDKPPEEKPETPKVAEEQSFFPKTESEKDMPPPEERTVMKQAAELLAEALKGAGGSMDEIGSAPMDAPAVEPPEEPKKAVAAPASDADTTPVPSSDPEPKKEEPKAATPSPAPAKAEPKRESARPAAREVKPAAAKPKPVEAAAPPRRDEEAEGGGSLKIILLVAALVGLVAGIYYFYNASQSTTGPIPTATTPPPPPPPTTVATPTATEEPEDVAKIEDAAPAATPEPAPEAAPPPATTPPKPPVTVPPKPPVTVPPKPPATVPPKPPATVPPKPPATVPPKPPATTPPDDDNPY